MDDLISVIVPIYNTEKYLNECIDSIINQTYTNLELILVDDGSNDNSGQICDEYSKNNDFIKVIHQQNMGISAARNKGLENATGDWIAFVDADDWLDNNYFQVLIDETLDGTQVVCSGYKRVCGTQVESINSDGKSFYFDGVSFTEKLLNVQNGYGFAHTKLYSKDAIKDVLFNTNVKVSEDALFNLDVALRNNKIKVVNKAMYNYRVTSSSTVRKYDEHYVEKYTDGMNACISFVNEHYNNNPVIMQNVNNYVVYHLLLIAVNYCYNPNNKNKHKQKLLKDICNLDIYKNAINKSDYQDLSLTRKITLFTIKTKLYFITGLICRIRQIGLKGN